MYIDIKLEKEELEKLKILEGFDNEDNSIETSYCDWIMFTCQPERSKREDDDKICVCEKMGFKTGHTFKDHRCGALNTMET